MRTGAVVGDKRISISIHEQHEGKWIVWDQDARQVVGSRATLDEAENQAALVKSDLMLRVHHVLPRNREFAEML
jgi:hypothetical protein